MSTDKQAEDGLGLDIQEQAIKAWAKANGHKVTMWCRDKGVSGSDGIDTRQGLPSALGALQDGTVGGMVATDSTDSPGIWCSRSSYWPRYNAMANLDLCR